MSEREREREREREKERKKGGCLTNKEIGFFCSPLIFLTLSYSYYIEYLEPSHNNIKTYLMLVHLLYNTEYA